ncbi:MULTISPECIES: hypothetical protein [unclassified Legionella]|uniref:hypothetical protein n=1 Tax=unclassified Legionella TaxID=2622702 RepID=UPI001E3C8350|nr:hypothetical protein [Legionella sp. 31fI33]MCC5014698.1 hypothetical protein [Legionella sp. 31fI33]
MKTITAVMWDPGDNLINKSLDEKMTLIEAKFKQAYQLAMAGDPEKDNTLVFLCPEFALLNMDASEKNFSYSKQAFQKAGERLQKLVDDFPKAIIIPGTTYMEKNLDLADAKKKIKYADTIKKWQLRNFKPAQDFQQEIAGMTLVKNTSTAFFHSGDGTHKPKRYSKRIEANELLEPFVGMFYPGHGEPFFTQNDIRFGLEICADHKEGVLVSEQRRTGQTVDVHLIVANTIYTIPNKVAKDTAIVINCAGSFQSDIHAAKATGVWIRDADGTLKAVEMSPCSVDDLRIYADIPLPTLKGEYSFSPNVLI